ncbi:hypothetical protein K1719_006891 [Acacia pycnantha]|nr:hypothetical protein K1719_006891 [Acacia pycnantha]
MTENATTRKLSPCFQIRASSATSDDPCLLRMFYRPGGPYALFAGKDASRVLAKMSFEEKDLTRDISGLSGFELGALQDWEYKFMSKYVKVGTVKSYVPITEVAKTNGEPSESCTLSDGAETAANKPTKDGPSEIFTDEVPSNVNADKE